MAAGRKNVWTTIIEPNLDKIKNWLESGLSEKQICERLNIGVSTWWAWKKKKPELIKFVYEGRIRASDEIENAMFKSACGFERKVRRAVKVKDIEYENGRKSRETERVEYYDDIEYYKPDTTAGIFLLTNWNKENYARDAATLELKKQELELKKEGSW